MTIERYGESMTDSERGDFRRFCLIATNKQLVEIIIKERESAQGGNVFRRDCLTIAFEEAKTRGIHV